jgi:hypothetical protein
MSSDPIKEKIFEALEDERYEWRSLKGISKQVGVSEEDVLSVIKENADFIVQSSVPSVDGDPLFTTKRHFHAKSSALDKILGAFKGRIR